MQKFNSYKKSKIDSLLEELPTPEIQLVARMYQGGPISNQWLKSPFPHILGSVDAYLPAGNTLVGPYPILHPVTISRLRAYASVVGAAAIANLVIYDSDELGRPKNLKASSTAAVSGPATVIATLSSNVPLEPGLYWTGIYTEGTQLAMASLNTSAPIIPSYSDASYSLNYSNNGFKIAGVPSVWSNYELSGGSRIPMVEVGAA